MAPIQDKRMTLDLIHQRLIRLAKETVAERRQTCAALAASLDALSPLKVLGRGYAVARDEAGNILKDAQQAQQGGRVHVTLGRGALACTVDEKKMSFEQSVDRLQEIVAALEKGDAPLADSLKLFEDGTKLVSSCTAMLEQAEQKVVKLVKSADETPTEEPFFSQEEEE